MISTKFNTFKRVTKIDPLENKDYTDKVKSFDEYITFTKMAAVENAGNSFDLYFNIEILLLLDRYAKFFAGEFTEVNNEEFSEIEEIFFKALWTNEAIYVAYGEKFVELELAKSKAYPEMNKWKVMPDCKWRIYVIQGQGKNMKYRSVISGIPDLKLDEEELLEVRWDHSHTWRFLSWWKIALVVHEYEQMFFELIKVAEKRVATKAANHTLSEAIKGAMLNCSPILASESLSGTSHYQGVEFAKIPELAVFYDTIVQWFYFNAGQLGYTGNTSDKAERMTTGEHVKDLKPIVNNQKCVLKNLEIFAKKAKEKWGQDLDFTLTSTQSMDGSGIQLSDAETPNGPMGNQKQEQKK